MQITRHQNIQKFSPKTQAVQAEKTLGDDGGSKIVDGFKTVAGVAMPLIPLAAGGTAAYQASSLFHLGKDSMPALYGVLGGGIVGGVVGGVAGGVLSHLYSKHSSDDQAGKGMMSGILTLGGAVGGVAVGAIGGFSGANPLVTVPAALVGTAATGAAMAFVADKIFD